MYVMRHSSSFAATPKPNLAFLQILSTMKTCQLITMVMDQKRFATITEIKFSWQKKRNKKHVFCCGSFFCKPTFKYKRTRRAVVKVNYFYD